MFRHRLWFVSVAACIVLWGCSDDQAPHAPIAARVGDETITRAAVVRAMQLEWPLSPEDGGNKVKPPRFTACITASMRRSDRLTPTTARARCREIYGAHEDYAVGSLIMFTWSRLAAREKGIDPPPTFVRRRLQEQVQALDPKDAARFRASPQLKRNAIRTLFVEERNKRLSDALNVSPEKLPGALAKQYGEKTRCIERFRLPAVPECTSMLTRR